MKYKVLITGQNRAIIDDFFSQTGDYFECQTTTSRLEDISCHVKYFEPDVFIYCMNKEASDTILRVVSIRQYYNKDTLPLIVAGSSQDCDIFTKVSLDAADLVLTKPFTVNTIRERILALLDHRQLTKKIAQKEAEEAERKRKEAEEAERKRREALAAERKRKEAEEAERKRKEAEEAERKRKEAEDAERKRREAEAERKLREVEEAERKIKETQETAPPSSNKKHILVVDDDPTMLKMVKRHLDDNYQVATAVNGKLALKFLSNKHTDLILLDFEMPGENGPAILKQIRENPATEDVPVIFLTGISARDKIQEALLYKPQGYLLKPIDRDQLISFIKPIIG